MSDVWDKPDPAQEPEPARPTLPPCCNSGCTVCVLDYPELFLDPGVADLSAMLEAVEQAVANLDCERDPYEE